MLVLGAATVVLARGGPARPLAVLLIAVAVAAAVAFVVGADAEACPEASLLGDDAEGGTRFAGLPVLADFAVVAGGAGWAAVALWRRGGSSRS